MPEQYHVLVVDDDTSSRALLVHLLGKEGYRVSQAENGSTCLELAATINPDLILLDVCMPGQDGIEVCRKLKADSSSRQIPVIFITALDKVEDILKGYAAGGTDYIIKPIHKTLTLARVNALLSYQQLLKDKYNLLAVNSLLVSKIDSFLKEVTLETKIGHIKNEVTQSINTLFDLLDNLKEHTEQSVMSLGSARKEPQVELLEHFKAQMQTSVALLDQAQMNLQFGDRVVQQFNEILKAVHKINSILSDEPELDKATLQSSTKFVLRDKVSQDTIDELFAALQN